MCTIFGDKYTRIKQNVKNLAGLEQIPKSREIKSLGTFSTVRVTDDKGEPGSVPKV